LEGSPLQVRVFTKASEVRLELNSKQIGEKLLSENDRYVAVFQVPYQPGELTAIALNDGTEIARKTIRSAGEPVAIRLTPERNSLKANRNDLAFVKIEVVDENGNVVPTDTVQVSISVSGAGELLGSGSGNPADMESVNNVNVKTFKGRAQAILRPHTDCGSILLKVASDGLTTGELRIDCE
jgi:beta-galactosidase